VHLFAVGIGLTPEVSGRLAAELARTATLYPQLDHDAIWHRRPLDGVYAGGVASPAAVAAPRVYLHETPSEIVFYDGLPIDPSGEVAAFQADALARHWDGLTDRLEGRFAVVRIRTDTGVVELINDAIGVMQLYWFERSGASIVSNSAGLVSRAIGSSEFDALGVSTMLTLGWVAGDRTLRRDVRVAPGAQHWRWQPGETAWRRRRYWGYTDAGPPTRRVDDSMVEAIGSSLARIAAAAAAVTGTINAPLTGGKDSRMLASVLIAHGVPTRFWTKGLPQSQDVRIAAALAKEYGWPHRITGRPTERDGLPPGPGLDQWDRLTRDFIGQNDGLPHLALVGNLLGQPSRVDQLATTLTALAAEIGRDAYEQPYLDGPGTSVERAVRYLAYRWAGVPRGLVARDAYLVARRHMGDTVLGLAESGVPLTNLSTVLFLDERARRWASNNPRELAQTEDKILIFLTRPFADAALSTHPEDRDLNLIHRRSMEFHLPGLVDAQPFSQPWHVSHPLTRKARLVKGVMSRIPYRPLSALTAVRERMRPTNTTWVDWTAYDEAAWLEERLDWARELVAGRGGSSLWSYVDRADLDRLLDPRTNRHERELREVPLFAALGLLLYEAIEDDLTRTAPSVQDVAGGSVS
jgi:asparagine synthase (glutamine-hydrolysing)